MRMIATIALAGAVACAGRDDARWPLDCVRPTLSLATFVRDSGSAFAISLPPSLRRVQIETVDSEGAAWRGQESELSYDFGAYSNPLTAAPYSGHACTASIGGRLARITRYADSSGFHVAGHWSGFPDQGMGAVSLTVAATARDSAQLPLLLASLWTITFRNSFGY
jgi:hypothetical protein